ncbi:hypothetical protein B0J14DRAFT_44554 [Halenospora varia]|nr:hypothetical protein B0J14DRAFT_44554 [Halenospora varia]
MNGVGDDALRKNKGRRAASRMFCLLFVLPGSRTNLIQCERCRYSKFCNQTSATGKVDTLEASGFDRCGKPYASQGCSDSSEPSPSKARTHLAQTEGTPEKQGLLNISETEHPSRCRATRACCSSLNCRHKSVSKHEVERRVDRDEPIQMGRVTPKTPGRG